MDENKRYKNETERKFSELNSNIFFKEFTFHRNDFKFLDSKQQLELADGVVWLDDIFFIYEIKEKDKKGETTVKKWFENKILKKAVGQIKKTQEYIKSGKEIILENERGHQVDIAYANTSKIQSLIIYSVEDELEEKIRHKKFHLSKSAGPIHLFYLIDYYWICKYLITPAEIQEYLIFRLRFFFEHGDYMNELPEQYILGHFLETLDVSELKSEYLTNLQKIDTNNQAFDIGDFLFEFGSIHETTQYYLILKEIAKLNRAEMSRFKERLTMTFEAPMEDGFYLPFRMYVPRTDCAFMFIPLNKENANSWEDYLYAFTELHKYDMKATKGIGVIFSEFRNSKGENEHILQWMFMLSTWEEDEELDGILKKENVFRKVKTHRIDNRYFE